MRIIDLKKRGDEIASVCQVLTEEDSDEEVTFDAEGLPTNESATPIQGEESPKDELPQELIDRALSEENQ